jgi:hypothetical protein
MADAYFPLDDDESNLAIFGRERWKVRRSLSDACL